MFNFLLLETDNVLYILCYDVPNLLMQLVCLHAYLPINDLYLFDYAVTPLLLPFVLYLQVLVRWIKMKEW